MSEWISRTAAPIVSACSATSWHFRTWLAYSLRPGHVERVVDQWLDVLHEPQRVRQAGVMLERRSISPSRMYVEEPGVTRRLERLNAQAARLLARRSKDVDQRLGHRALIARTRVESREDE
jgi:hypothetical protein